MVRFHESLTQRARDNARFQFHYVTAREMYNLVKAAEAGWTGSVDAARDYALTCPIAGPGGSADNSGGSKLLSV
jgi:hypothetical protein